MYDGFDNIFPKFIIEGDNLIIGRIDYHKNLADDVDNVIGGGWWKRIDDTFQLYGRSEDFGEAKLEDIKKCVENKDVYTHYFATYSIADKFKFEYLTTSGEIIKLN